LTQENVGRQTELSSECAGGQAQVGVQTPIIDEAGPDFLGGVEQREEGHYFGFSTSKTLGGARKSGEGGGSKKESDGSTYKIFGGKKELRFISSKKPFLGSDHPQQGSTITREVPKKVVGSKKKLQGKGGLKKKDF